MGTAQLHADGEGEDGVVGIAEDDERELWLLMIESQLLQAVEQMTFLKTVPPTSIYTASAAVASSLCTN